MKINVYTAFSDVVVNHVIDKIWQSDGLEEIYFKRTNNFQPGPRIKLANGNSLHWVDWCMLNKTEALKDLDDLLYLFMDNPEKYEIEINTDQRYIKIKIIQPNHVGDPTLNPGKEN